jgi:large subunit ribosomal protein L10Ae
MSKLTNTMVRDGVVKALEERKKRKFVESIDLQVMFRDFNPEKDKRFNSTTVLSYPVKSNMKICMIGTMKHIEEAQKLNIETANQDDLKKFNNEAKMIKKWARKYDVLLVSESLSRNVTKLIGRYVTSIGKLPVPIGENESVETKREELLKTIRFRVKKSPWLGQSVGIDTNNPDEIRQNILKSLNFLVSLLPKGWHNLKSVHIKTTMGKPQRLI